MKKYLEKISRKNEDEIINDVCKKIKNKEKEFIVTVNPESIMLSRDNEELSNILLDSNTLKVPDGISVVKACRKCGIPINKRITGIDLMQKLLEIGNEYKLKIYLIGAKDEVIKKLVEKINIDYPNINIVGYKNGYCSDYSDDFKIINKEKVDLVFVALGIPKQELLINKYFNKVNQGIYMGVGGSFDVLSGLKKRAPKIFIKLNLEWLYRIIKEPARLKRFYQNNIKFMWLIKK